LPENAYIFPKSYSKPFTFEDGEGLAHSKADHSSLLNLPLP